MLRPSWFSPSRQRNVRARNPRKGISTVRRPRGHRRLTKRSIRSGFSDIRSGHVKLWSKCAQSIRDIGGIYYSYRVPFIPLEDSAEVKRVLLVIQGAMECGDCVPNLFEAGEDLVHRLASA